MPNLDGLLGIGKKDALLYSSVPGSMILGSRDQIRKGKGRWTGQVLLP